jgi:hypothetical protein
MMAVLEPVMRWALQCEFEGHFDVGIEPPALYFINPSGLYGCSLDHSGRRRFPRPLVPVIRKPVIRVRSLNLSLVFNPDTKEVLEVMGRALRRFSLLAYDGTASYKALVALGNRIFGAAEESIDTFDLVSGELIDSVAVPKTEKWIVSLEKSYGAVFVGTKSFTVSRGEVGPFINLYGPSTQVMAQLQKAKDRVGTVAVPILMMANRSTYLAAVLNQDDVATECRKQTAPGTIQEHIHPTLMKLHDLLLNKPT